MVQTLLPMLENQAYLGRCVYNQRTLSKWHRYRAGTSVERMDEGVERRGKEDWVTCEDAWPSLVTPDVFEQVQLRRKQSRERKSHRRGPSMRSEYLLTGLMFCGVCGGKLGGHTYKNTKGVKTRYYVCSRHSAGHKHECPKRYTVPAKLVEQHILTLVRQDLTTLKDDDQLHQTIATELERIAGGRSDARDQLSRQLSRLDQQAATVREHLMSIDAETAQALGLYDKAKTIRAEYDHVATELAKLPDDHPALPDPDAIRHRAEAEFDRLEQTIVSATVEEKRELIACYVQKIKADPDQQSVQIGLYPTLLSQKIAGTGFEPVTSGL